MQRRKWLENSHIKTFNHVVDGSIPSPLTNQSKPAPPSCGWPSAGETGQDTSDQAGLR